MTEAELREMARQLSNPVGENGKKVAAMMNDGNHEMILKGIEALEIRNRERILEPGHAGGGHLKALLDSADDIHYTGLEISKDMRQMAEQTYKDLRHKNPADFLVFDGLTIPLPDTIYDKILTVNTIYFWTEPQNFASELLRVLRSGGSLVLVFAPKHFMERLPFTSHIFKLYEPDEVVRLLKSSGFENIDISSHIDWPISKSGDKVERPFQIIRAFKPI
ncbi:class I SAM-dependent methyltransferase [Flavobacterium silvaticum]|uniref:Class I SAM-dependent methyltransferase n=1 Tax=Flavobacterium silvaticum TaxID=1852020 RepID=A0A972FSG4_9FLAO|nr:class I SAM-dependent methyltransferase [Flavobacterium silvaticum]NMH27172.1 class I SAM-dependent methyltransferase [Flavobacterium silvaticum]